MQNPPRTAGHLDAARMVSSNTNQVLVSALRAAGARRVLDLGCGDGAITAMLAAEGFEVTGVDPSSDAIEAARQKYPALRFIQAGAETLPDNIGPFDACCIVNALHHVPQNNMALAVLNAVRLVAPAGLVHIIEPLAEGSFFFAMLPVEDETAIRRQAIETLDGLISSGQIVLHDVQRWLRDSAFSDLQGFVDRLVQVDPTRAHAAEANKAALARAWEENIQMTGDKAHLTQPLACWTVGAPKAKP